ncbi:MAG: LysR family transcriptional regulator [Betaproteobacteria bacterium]
MDLRDLKNFKVVVEEGNISNAAKKLHLSQPPLSRQMSQLEESLGLQLFERGRRQVRLTNAGHLLHARSLEILGLVEKTVKEVSALNSGVAGEIAIGTIATTGAAYLPNWIKQFNAQCPDVTFQLWEGDSYRIFDLLDKGIVELGLVRTPLNEDVYDFLPMPVEPLTIAWNPAYFQLETESEYIGVKELGDTPLILYRRYLNMFLDHCKKHDFTPNIKCISDGVMQDLIWVREGLAVSLRPSAAHSILKDKNLVFKPFFGPKLTTQAAVITVKGRYLSTATRHFVSQIACELSQCPV